MISSLSLGAFSAPAATANGGPTFRAPTAGPAADAGGTARLRERPLRSLSSADAAAIAGDRTAAGRSALPRGSLLDILG